MKKIIKYGLFTLSSILIFIILLFVTNTVVDHIQYDLKISDFKAKCTLVKEEYGVKYYSYKKEGEAPGYYSTGSTVYPGNYGDVIVSPNATLVNEFISGFVSYFAGGHAAFVTKEFNDYEKHFSNYDSIEATGMNEGLNPSQIANRAYWINDRTFKEAIGLRMNGITDEQKDELMSIIYGELGDYYNFSFGLFENKSKSYCSDLISKAYNRVGYDLNKDKFFTTIYDLVVSPDCYISYYHYFDSDGVKHIYYIE